MGGYYLIAGRKIANEYLVIATLGALAGGIAMATGGEKKPQSTPQAIAATTFSSNNDEDSFIKAFLKEADASEGTSSQKH
ncbi:MAG: hypothetical protein DHS80DRAFT_33155 [Piptocephalis tieghemiana]|nr:MAG: hypothetical protein DHS80DRAFT_33155 [Piptocephalis tieghemiana]